MSHYDRIGQYRATFYGGGGSEGIYQTNFFCYFIQIYHGIFNFSEIKSFLPIGGPLENLTPCLLGALQNPKNSRFHDKLTCFCWENFPGGLDDSPPPKFCALAIRTMTLKILHTNSMIRALLSQGCFPFCYPFSPRPNSRINNFKYLADDGKMWISRSKLVFTLTLFSINYTY